MQGSFSPQSASKFMELMREAGYDTRETSFEVQRENFSGGVSQRVDPWEGNVANFGEARGEYIENYDYTRCVRPDGSSYGSRGKCRKGTESAGEKPVKRTREEREKAASESTVKKEKYSWGNLIKVSKGNEYKAILHPEHQDQIRKLKDGESTKFKDEQGMNWGALRKGDTIHLVGGDRGYGGKPYRLSFNRSHLGEDTKPKANPEEKSAIDQLSQMLPKGEKIVDSLGNISVTSGGRK